MSFFKKILEFFINTNKRELKKITPIIQQINFLEKKIAKKSDEGLRLETEKFKKRLKEGETLNDILPEAFAVCREAAKRAIGERHYDVQLMGGISLHKGKIVEMKTGEGKTLVSTLPIYLNALAGKGVHVVTVNDYLARRDTNWMGSIYHFLGLKVGCIQSNGPAYLFSPKIKPDSNEVTIEYENLLETSKKEAYQADITYGTNNEFGFDYLRDNMVLSLEETVQIRNVEELVKREKKLLKIKNKKKLKNEILKKNYLNYAIVDEVDSILIDEARTPLIISAPDIESAELYQKFAKIVPQLEENKDFNVDEKMQTVSLTDIGVSRVEKILNIQNIYASGEIQLVHHLHQALKAQVLFKKDKQYLVKDGEILIVDEFTGRLMPGRRFSEGLHQALEAKEGVKVQRESKTLATITFQNYFRLYKKLSGMTGTALTSAEEFSKVYGLEVIAIPTHRLMIRKDLPDVVYKNEDKKFFAIAQEVKKRNKKGQPVLIGTASVEKSEVFSKYLNKEGVEYEILNAKNHEKEAQIIAQAGQKRAVTIATNMAGRGTDIKLGEGVKELGGLLVIGTERHDARRIDNQLRGRSGRQGDPGISRFYVSLEDELMRRFIPDRIRGIMNQLPDDQPIESRLISRSIETAQNRIEGHNFDIRKHVLEYDDVVNLQREAIYQRRRQYLLDIFGRKEVERLVKDLIVSFVSFHTKGEDTEVWNLKEINEYAITLFKVDDSFQKELEEIKENSQELKEKRIMIIQKLKNYAIESYINKEKLFTASILRKVEKMVMLRTLDTLWMEHLDHIQFLREGIGLRGYGQRDPLVEFKRESFEMFQNLLDNIRLQAVETLFKINLKIEKTPMRIRGKIEQVKTKGLPVLDSKQEKNKQEEVINQKRKELTEKILKDQNQIKNNLKLSAYNTEQQINKQKTKIGRNDPCFCGSGKKYKKCCGKK